MSDLSQHKLQKLIEIEGYQDDISLFENAGNASAIAFVPQPPNPTIIPRQQTVAVLSTDNLSASRNRIFRVAFLHQTRAPSPRVGVQSNSAGSSPSVRW